MEIARMNYYFTGILIILMVLLAILGGPPGYWNNMDSEAVLMISRLWPIFVAFILLIVTLAQAHYRIKVLEEKVKVAFELINKLTSK